MVDEPKKKGRWDTKVAETFTNFDGFDIIVSGVINREDPKRRMINLKSARFFFPMNPADIETLYEKLKLVKSKLYEE